MSASYYFVAPNSKAAYPAEIGMAKFNLEDGLIDTLHIKVDPGELPVGCASFLKEHADKTHGYDVPPTSEGAEGDYKAIFNKISEFLGVAADSKRPRYPPIFVSPKYGDMEDVKLVLETITVEANQNINFRVYPMEQLLFQLQKMMLEFRPNHDPDYQKFPSVDMARDCWRTDPFSFMPIGCEFHNEGERAEHCCLAKVIRSAGIIAKKLLDPKFDDIEEGRHIPLLYDAKDNDDIISVASRSSSYSSIAEMMRSCSLTSLKSSGVADTGDESEASTVKSIDEVFKESRRGRVPYARK